MESAVSRKSQGRIKGAKEKRIKAIRTQCDFTILFTVGLLVLFGLVMIFSSSYYYALNHFNDMYYFLKKQALWSVIGFSAMIFMMNYDYKNIKLLAIPGYIVSQILLVLVLLIGQKVNGSKRWLFGFQPSELAKLTIIFFMALIISYNRNKLKKFSGLLFYLIFVAIPVVLIAIQNLSTAIVVLFIGVAMLFVASPKIWHFFVLALPVLGGGAAAVMLPQFAYRLDRIQIWKNPWIDPTGKGYQPIQSLYAVGSGGLFGLGLGESRQKLGFIPEAHNDIIFAIVCEELGLVGAIALLSLFLILIWRGIKVAINAPDLFSSLVASGIVCMIGIQVLINVAVITKTIPTTGMPLPFISYGGSSLLFTMSAMGILLNISRYSKLNKL
ncbi:MAG: cell division protein FtsW [Epulopiscium sp.]|uniref:Probable peptidoglycan glycosyltransferase FtsW n=1 Tax=Defluviitalea raffinosedens TaxID=1450156 RepID=A0A7C8LGJ5_9FIRM|nr:putative lipid II flippase FtsW [Defluviitalea raffinosedens]MBZ4667943.1 stage sporulation protein [Defluviitaleaceae bacterium]MDK2789040.1 cell division protein FtsW [Candidatus Epulonipiscium sp.]KAE9637016.1 putative lipid II flippase FtsW [Defluviitalea raffinosedens]MBM7685229.1 cell division protein FtsW [Defluviitalea raffinosedens]HHW67332.1 putative lipid II flippase FtsW [Candidatus Epulonipiscium sp.]